MDSGCAAGLFCGASEGRSSPPGGRRRDHGAGFEGSIVVRMRAWPIVSCLIMLPGVALAFNGDWEVTVPEPTTMLLLVSGLLGLWGLRKKFMK